MQIPKRLEGMDKGHSLRAYGRVFLKNLIESGGVTAQVLTDQPRVSDHDSTALDGFAMNITYHQQLNRSERRERPPLTINALVAAMTAGLKSVGIDDAPRTSRTDWLWLSPDTVEKMLDKMDITRNLINRAGAAEATERFQAAFQGALGLEKKPGVGR
jgi:hypothetical protein